MKNKLKSAKRLLAFMCVFSLFAGMLPIPGAEGMSASAAVGDVITYNFTGMLPESYTSKDAGDFYGDLCVTATGKSSNELSDLAKLLTSEYTSGKGSAPWSLATVLEYEDTKAITRLYANNGLLGYVYDQTHRQAEVGVKLTVKDGQEGWYRVKANHKLSISGGDSGADARLEIYKGANAASSLKLSSYNVTEQSSFTYADMGRAYFASGDYYFLIHLNASTAGQKNHYLYVKDVVLEEIAEPSDGGDELENEYVYTFNDIVPTRSYLADVSDYKFTTPSSGEALNPDSKTSPWCFGYIGGEKITLWNAPNINSAELGYGVGAAAGIKIKVLENGIFTPSLVYRTSNISGKARMYIAPVDAENPRAEEYSVGNLQTYAETAVGGKEAIFRSCYLEQGEYMVSWEIIQQTNQEKAARLYFSELKLKKQKKYPTVTIEPEGLPEVIKLGNNAEVKLNTTVSGDAIEDFVGAEFKMEADDELPVDTEIVYNDDGSISLNLSSVKTGEANLKVSVIMRGVERASFTLPVKVEMPGELDEVSISLRESADNTLICNPVYGNRGHIDVVLKDVDGDRIAPEIANAEYSFSSSNEDVATVDEDGVLSVLSDGTTVISYDVTIGNVTKHEEIEITVLPLDGVKATRDYKYTFVQSAPLHSYVNTVTDLAMTTAGSGSELRPGSGTDPWCFAHQNKLASTFWIANDYYGGEIGYSIGGKAGIKIHLPASGIFTPEFEYRAANICGVMRMYIAPADAEDPMADEYSVGMKDTYSETAGQMTMLMRTQFMPAGDYIVSWEVIGQNPDIQKAPRIYPSNVFLRLKDEYPTVTVTPEGELPAIKLGNNTDIKLNAIVSDGSAEDCVGAEFEVVSENANAIVAPVKNEDGSTSLNVTGIKIGEQDLQIKMLLNGVERAMFTLPVNVIEPDDLETVSIGLYENKYDTLTLRALSDVIGHAELILTDTAGDEISPFAANLRGASYNFTSSDEAVARVDGDGVITPISAGTTVIRCDITIDGVTRGNEFELTVSNGKGGRTYYTDKKVTDTRNNISNYSWARTDADSKIKEADLYVDKWEDIYDMIPTQELPRSYLVGYWLDPATSYCRHPDCGTNLVAEFGIAYAWKVDMFNSPWKVQCPACRRKFPTNDFGSFYQLGIVEADETEQYGVPSSHWSYEKAHYEHYKLFAGSYADADISSYEEYDARRKSGERMPAVGYLKNILYPELEDTWGVDDGYGYVNGNTWVDTYKTTDQYVKSVDTYISYYNHYTFWSPTSSLGSSGNTLLNVVKRLRDAYIYTGEAKYGRAGAILIDRIADIYPDLSTKPYMYFISPTARLMSGKGSDRIWECTPSREWSLAYDAFFPAYDDAQVVSFLSQKATQYDMDNKKTDGNQIRENIEFGILRELFEGAQAGDLNGNFGMAQAAVAAAAVALDNVPESFDMIDWIFQDGDSLKIDPNSWTPDNITGGNVMRQIVNSISRDGTNTENGANYIRLWYSYTNTMLDILAGYDKYPQANLWNNPKYVKMAESLVPFTMSRASSVQIGDSGSVADQLIYLYESDLTEAYKQTGKPIFAQMLYFMNGNSSKGLHYDIYTEDAERLEKEVQDVINTYGEYDFDQSNLLAGYGLAALRGGTLVESVAGDIDTQRTFWMSFTESRSSGHTHYDVLNLGIEAYGLNISPELAYPEKTSGDINLNWARSTVSHNAVVVDRQHQSVDHTAVNYLYTDAGEPLHFDDSGFVKLMDADGSHVYNVTDKYRRTVVTVDVNEELSYGVDFFRVKGGNEHLYSFHALSSLMPEVGINGSDEKISFTPQTDPVTNEYVGSYAGADVPYKTEGNASGFTWLYNVDRTANLGSELYIDFEIQDFRKTLEKDRDLHLKLTMLNDFELSELAFANGSPADSNNNPDYLKFMLAKREGESLDSLFTTVIEPYDGASNIEKLEQVSVTDKDGNAVDTSAVKAVKVTLKSGRVDYIIYAEDNSVEYLVDSRIAFQGFVGVYCEQNGENVYSYMNDGIKLGALTGTANLSGTVESFTTELTDENFITVKFEQDIVPEELAGEHIYVQEFARGNGVYKILGAKMLDEAERIVELDIGDVTLIDTIADSNAGEYTYNYNIAADATFRIPLATAVDNSPVITPVADAKVTAGKSFSKRISASSPIDKKIFYEAVSLPRGASFDAERGTVTWTPDEKQVGTNAVAIRATDGALSSVIYFNVDVVKSAGSVTEDSGSSDSGNDSTGTGSSGTGSSGTGSDSGSGSSSSTGSSSGTGSGSGSGAGASSGGSDSGDNTTGEDTTTEDSTGGDDNADATAERFIDLAGYDWAKDAINSLANAGVINGTSPNTYSPGKDITRADFAVLLVRAFGLESDSGDNFADVNANAYYAKELAVAKAHGIVNGVGENKYNPTATITRQDMMTIVSRALAALDYELEEATAEALAAYADAATVSDYAAEHAARLIANEIVKGSNGRINPKSNTTRAEVAVLIRRIIDTFIGK